MSKKVLISHPWFKEDIPHFDEITKQLTDRGCEVVIYPERSTMTEDDIIKWMDGCVAHVCGGVQWTRKAMEHLPEVKVIARIGVGFETVDIPAATEHKIAVATTPGAGAETVSEFAFTLLATMSRKIMQNDRMVRSGGWTTVTGMSFYRKTLGIVGLGLIGKQLARWAQGFGMHILAYDPFMDEEYARNNGITYVSLEELLKQSDYISLHLPLMPSTRNLIGEREFAMMKPTAQLINAARGGIVNEEALYHALKDHRIDMAAIDVFEKEPLPADSPLLQLDNIIFTPHVAGSTYEGLDSIYGAAVRNVCEYLDGKTPHGIRNPEALR